MWHRFDTSGHSDSPAGVAPGLDPWCRRPGIGAWDGTDAFRGVEPSPWHRSFPIGRMSFLMNSRGSRDTSFQRNRQVARCEFSAGQCTRCFIHGPDVLAQGRFLWTVPFRWAFGPWLIAKSWDQHGEACIESSDFAALPSGALAVP